MSQAIQPPVGDAPDADAAQFRQRLGALLTEARLSARLSREDVAARSQGRFAGGALRMWERGDRNITVDRLAALAGIYGIDPAQIIARAEWGVRTDSAGGR